jgi:hypothetical protein
MIFFVFKCVLRPSYFFSLVIVRLFLNLELNWIFIFILDRILDWDRDFHQCERYDDD